MSRVWHAIRPFLAGIGVLVALAALILIPTLATTGSITSQFRALNQAARNATPSEQATNGPLPGDLSLYATEQRCSEQLKTPGYYPSLNGAEIADGSRSGVFPCATFTGSITEPNQVFAYKSEGNYQGTSYISNKGPNATFVTGGNQPAPSGTVQPGPFVARINPITGAEVWRTYLENANVNNVYIATTNLNILDDGSIVTSWNTSIAKLDADSGAILAQTALPTGAVAPSDASYKHLTVAPDRTIILKDQNRPAGCLQQGSSALIQCPGAGDPTKQANSDLVAVNPDTLEVLDHVVAPEESTTPHIITTYQGRIAVYFAANKYAYRYFWDPATRKLTQDTSWVADYLQPGQSTGDAPTLMGKWICIQTNGIGGSVPSTVECIDTDNAGTVTTATPFGQLESGQTSFAPPKAGGDPENNMLYSADSGVGKVAGIRLDPQTGQMTNVFVVDDKSTEFQPLIGPKDQRVLLTTKVNPDASQEDQSTGTYSEQVVWRDAATGRALAESGFLPPFTGGSLLTPGYGGRVYYMTLDNVYTLQPIPSSKVPPEPESAS